MNVRGLVVGAALVAALAVLSGGASGQEARGGKVYKTPQEVFDVAQGALKKGDWAGFAACLTEKSRDQLAGQMALGALYIVQDFGGAEKAAKAKEELKKALARHGLTEAKLEKLDVKPGTLDEADKLQRGLLEAVKDRNAFIGDIMAAMEKMSGKKKDASFDARLMAVKVEGDKATGTVVTRKGKSESRETFTFRKVGGGWRIDISARAPAKAPL